MFLSHGVPSINLVGMVVIMAPRAVKDSGGVIGTGGDVLRAGLGADIVEG